MSGQTEINWGEELDLVGANTLETWTETSIGEICASVKSGGTPLSTVKEYYENGQIPWLKTKEIKNARIYGAENYITELGLRNSSASLIPANSISVAMYGDGGTAGRVGLTKVPLTTNQACCNLTVDEQKADYEFVFYKLLGSYDELVGMKTGSGQQNLSASLVKNFRFNLPLLLEQRAIASILSSLDEKIDLLYRQNTTLEALAETLFRQWFVEEAKDEWEEVSLGDFFPVVTGKKDANYSNEGGQYPFFTCSQNALRCNNFSFEGYAILLAGNGDFNVKRYRGRFEAYQRTYVLISYDEHYVGFLYVFMKYLLHEITSSSRGSVISFITKGTITDFKFALPLNREIIYEKLDQFNGLHEKVDSNLKQIETLTILRDTLLHKLMSGEVRVAY